ncbi:MAG: restriction endonuclease subunit S [Pirellula sp.]|nr:restriction endonuclease subunit S [Pirellula sp.]
MIEGLRPYSEYRDSGIPWLGSIPAHWDVRRNGRLFAERTETGFPDLPILEVSLRTGVRVRDFDSSLRKQVIADKTKYKRACQGDIAYNMMRMWQGAVGVAPVDGLISPAYVVARPFPDTNTDYFAHLFRTDAYKGEVNNYSRGIVSDRNRLYWEEFKQIPTPFPPPDEQSAIVRFIDHADRRIRRCIGAKRRLIALLNEQKRAIIHRAVTRGLDSNVHFKPSGTDWLGDVPEHWTVSRIKTEFACLNRRRVPLSSTERGTMTTRTYDYYGASGVIDKVDDFLFDEELLLIAEDGANLVLRNLPLAIIARGKFWVNNHAHILKPRRGKLEYLAHLLETLNYLPWISGAAQPKLTQDRLMSIAIAVPSANEQQRILDATRSETASLTDTIQKAKRELELLHEYRVRLIADVVTGKLDVREAARRLSEVIEEQGVSDELGSLTDGEEVIEDLDLDTESVEIEA